MQISVDDQDYTTEWLRSGAVLAAVTGTPRPAAGCNNQAARFNPLSGRRQPRLHGSAILSTE
jgi:hypothetical protein